MMRTGTNCPRPPGGTLTYDPENRLSTSGNVQYAYDAKNKRVWAGAPAITYAQAAYFFGARGELLGEYVLALSGSTLSVRQWSATAYFGKKRIAVTDPSGQTHAFTPDRIGSAGQFYPWGEDKGGNSPQDTWSFATYWRN
jgi:hypothetical protein